MQGAGSPDHNCQCTLTSRSFGQAEPRSASRDEHVQASQFVNEHTHQREQ